MFDKGILTFAVKIQVRLVFTIYYGYFKPLVKTSRLDDPAVFVMESIHLKRFGRKGNNQS